MSDTFYEEKMWSDKQGSAVCLEHAQTIDTQPPMHAHACNVRPGPTRPDIYLHDQGTPCHVNRTYIDLGCKHKYSKHCSISMEDL